MPWHTVHSRNKAHAASKVTKKHFTDALAKQHHLTKKQGRQMLEDLLGLITEHLKNGERVKIAGLGKFQVRISCCPRRPQSGDR